MHSNGYLTLIPSGRKVQSYGKVPRTPLGSLTRNPMIAGFWADHDNRASSTGLTYYRESNSAADLSAIGSLIGGGYTPEAVLIVTYDRISFWKFHDTPVSSYTGINARMYS